MKRKLYDLLWEVAQSLFLDNDLFIKDINTIQRRWITEGDSFLLKILPKFAKHIEICIEKGTYTVTNLFKKRYGTVLPHFLHGLTSLIFDENGNILSNVNVGPALAKIRQVCYFFYKINKPSSILQETEAVEKFLSIEEENRNFECNFIEHVSEVKYKLNIGSILDRAYKIASDIFRNFSLENIVPHDSSGAVADKRDVSERINFKTLYKETNGKYSYLHFYDIPHCNVASSIARISRYSVEEIENKMLIARRKNLGLAPIEYRDYATARFCLVPKDGRGPRIITIEPAELQYFQQGQRDIFVKHIERHPITRGHVNFTDQSINKMLAYSGSIDRSNCTLDLSDASDRVTSMLVRRVFPYHIWAYLEATRSHEVRIEAKNIPGCAGYNAHAGTYALHKFAGMGSGMCFPVEAVVFFCLAKAVGDTLGYKDKPYVYGDDIIAHHGLKDPLTRVFKMLNLKINSEKSFEASFFRESCGGDYYQGHDVTPVRMKTMPDGFETVSSLIKLCDRLHLSMQWRTEKAIQRLLVRTLQRNSEVTGKKPWIPLFSASYDTPGMLTQYFSKSLDPEVVFGKRITKWNKALQKVLYPQVVSVIRDKEVIQEANYLRWFTRTRNTEQKAHVFSFFGREYKLKFL